MTEQNPQSFFPNSSPIDAKNEIELVSENDFFELFVPKVQKCHVPIPSTCLFQDGKLVKWLFYHKDEIKFKSSSKLELKQLYDSLFQGGRLTEEEMLGSMMSPNKHLNEMLFLNSKPEVAVIRTTSYETLFINPFELRKIFEERYNDLRILQTIIPCETPEKNINGKEEKKLLVDLWKAPKKNTKNLETFYCKYVRNFGFGNYLVFRKTVKSEPKPNDVTYLKTLNRSKETSTLSKSIDFNKNMTLDFLYNVAQISTKNLGYKEFTQNKYYFNKSSFRFYFKSFDNDLNQTLQKLTSDLINYWESLYGFTVQSLTTKFLHDQINKNNYYIGAKRFVILRKNPFDTIVEENGCYLKTSEIQSLYLARAKFLKVLGNHSKSLEKLKPAGTVQILSKKLLNNLALEECSGDFCKYEFLAPEKEMLKPKILEYLGQNIMNHNQKVLGSEFGLKLPFVLMNKTLINVRTKWVKVVEILKKHRIVPPFHTKEPANNSLTDLSEIDYPPGNPKRTWTLKPSDLYRKVKICGRCFQIYSFISSSGLLCEMDKQSSKWNHSEKKFHEKAKEFKDLLSTKPLNSSKKKQKSFKSMTSRDTKVSSIDYDKAEYSLDKVESAREKISEEHKLMLKHVKTQNEQIMDSTRLNLGLIFNHETPLSKMTLNTVSKQINRIVSHRIHKSSSEIFREFGRSGRINFGVIDDEDLQSQSPNNLINFPLKRKLTSSHINSIELMKKRESLTEKLLMNLSKNFDRKRSKVLDFYESRKRILTLTQQRKRLETSSLFHFKELTHLRSLPDYKLNIPKLCLHKNREKCKKKLYDVSFENLLDVLARKDTNFDFSKERLFELYKVQDLTQRVQVYVYDEFTAIPYVIIQNNNKSLLQTQLIGLKNIPRPPKLQKKEVCIVVHDFFHNCLEYISFYQSLVNKFLNKTIILFNYPGQAFTIYDSNELWNNVSLANLLDSFLYYLNEKGQISMNLNSIKLIGLGYGGLILSYFLGTCEDALSLNSCLLVNSFTYLDELTFSTLSTCIETFESTPEDLPELAFDYYWRLTCTSRPCDGKTLENKFLKNPITTQAMTYILKGCFQSVNCSEKIQFCMTPLFIIHSLQNSLIRVSQVDLWNRINEEKVKENNKNIFGLKMRTCAYIEGGHDVIEENIKNYEKIVLDYLIHGGNCL